VAREGFAEFGFAGTSLAELARRVGLTKASLLHHFESKEALYLSALAQTVADLGRLVIEAGFDRGSHLERLDRLGETVVDYLGEHPAAASLLLSELIGRGPFGQGDGAAQVDATLRAVATFLQSGMDAGVFAEQSPQQLTMSIVGVHLVYFAAREVTRSFVGEDPVAPAMLETRRRAVREQVRALCLGSGV